MKKDRPIVHIEDNAFDKQTHLVSMFMIGIMIVTGVYFYAQLPAQIPIHFNFSGTPDSYGSKTTLFIIPLMAITMMLFLNYVAKTPHKHNIPYKITKDNAYDYYRLSKSMTNAMKVSVVLIFLILEFIIIKSAFDNDGSGFQYIVLVILALVFIPIIYFMIQMKKVAKT